MEKEIVIAPGDVVELKSGSLEMVVDEIMIGNMAKVIWYTPSDKIEERLIRLHCLQKTDN